MPMVSSYAHGTFSWVELGTTDSDSAKEFYGDLFGWTFRDMPAGPGMTYTMCALGAELVAALYQMGGAMKDAPPHWASYITVDDVDSVARKAAANGGSVVKEPFEVLDVGRMAVIRDPAGASFCLWTGKKHVGAAVVREPGALIWNELMTPDCEAAKRFYEATIGWTAQDTDMGPMGRYTLWKSRAEDETSLGGMMAMAPESQGVPPHWLAYFGVAHCDESAERAEHLGGKLLVHPKDIPNTGRFAVVQDPQGAVFAVFKPKMRS